MQFEKLKSKSDYINYCLQHCSEILDIDSAIPAEIHKACKSTRTPTEDLCTIHYISGEVTYENIIGKAVAAYGEKHL